MAEGLSAAEVGKEIGEHSERAAHNGSEDRGDRLLSITEALLLLGPTSDTDLRRRFGCSVSR